MDKIWNRAAIKCLQKMVSALKDIHTDVIATFGSDALNLSMLQKWSPGFRRGRELEYGPKFGRPATVTTKENNDLVHNILMDDMQMTVNKIANDINLSRQRAGNILHNKFGILALDKKRTRLITSEENLILFEADSV